VECPRCKSDVPEVSHFCHHCGADLRSGDAGRKKAYAAKPDEPVASFRLVSTIMPYGTGQRPSTYRIALGIALAITVAAAALGALPVALMVAAFAVPIVYILYLYDVNLWEDEPVPVVAVAFAATGVLAALFTWLWNDKIGISAPGPISQGIQGRDLLILLLLVPVVSELLRQAGPLYLASRPKFDDLMDGLTFGVVSGVAYACFETLVLHWSWISAGFVGPDAGIGTWLSVVVLHGFVKPMVYGSATGLAAAEFSGLGEKYDGFTPRWVAGVLQAVAVNAAFNGGAYLLGFIGGRGSLLGQVLGLVWGLLILGALVVRVRTVLHKGLLEAALESASRGGSKNASGALALCPQCEMPLLAHSDFCSTCGNSVRAAAKTDRAVIRQGAAVSAPEPTLGEGQA